MIIVTKHGKCICFSEDDVRPMGRIAGGVRAIKLEGDDEVVSMELVQPHQELLVVTTNGYGKRTPVDEYKIQVRGGKGLLTYDKTKFKKTGELVGAMVVNEDDEILLIRDNSIWFEIINPRTGERLPGGATLSGESGTTNEDNTAFLQSGKSLSAEFDGDTLYLRAYDCWEKLRYGTVAVKIK